MRKSCPFSLYMDPAWQFYSNGDKLASIVCGQKRGGVRSNIFIDRPKRRQSRRMEREREFYGSFSFKGNIKFSRRS